MKKLILVSLLAISMAACGGKDDEKGGGGSGDVMKDAVGVMKEMAAATEAAGEDCGKMAEGLDKVLEANKGKLEAAKKFGEDMKSKTKDDPKAAEKMMKELGPVMGELMSSGMKLGTAMAKCGQDEKMKAFQAKYMKYQ